MSDPNTPQDIPSGPSSAYTRVLQAHLIYLQNLRADARGVTLVADLDQEIAEYEAKLAALGAPDQGSDSPVL